MPADNDKERQKECPICNLMFKKLKGMYHKWKMGTLEEFMLEEIKI